MLDFVERSQINFPFFYRHGLSLTVCFDGRDGGNLAKHCFL